MRIALVTPVMPVPYDQSKGQFILETARSMSRMATVRVYFLRARYVGITPSSYVDGNIPDDYSLDGIDLEVVKYPVFPVLSRGINPYVSSRRLTPRFREFKPDIVLGYWIYPDGYAAQLSAEKLGIPNVLGALGSDIHHDRRGFSVTRSRQALQRADATVTVSRRMTQAVVNDYGADPDKVVTVPNGYNDQIFYPRDAAKTRQELNLPADKKIVLFVGRLVEGKGLRELLQAFEQLHATDPSCFLVIAGEGPMRKEIESTLANKGLAQASAMPGSIAPGLVGEYLGASDLLTLPSWSEGYPNVLVEALACGRPVVTTSVGGIPEFVNETNGVFVEVKNASSLLAGLQKALAAQWNPQDLADSVRRSWTDVANETLDVIKAVLARKT